MPELTLPRLQLFEFHDMRWFPGPLRLGTTESLAVLSQQVGLAQTVAPFIEGTLNQTGISRIIDLCSGSCGPMVPLVRELALKQPKIQVIATDRYPSYEAFAQAERASGWLIRGYPEPVDARHVPTSLRGMRTLFNAFHHFPPDEARAILKDAHDCRQPIGVFEITNRSIGRTLGVFPGSILLALTAARRFKSVGLRFFSYAIPIMPLTFAWDGLVSCFRSYTIPELRRLTEKLSDAYQWEYGQQRTLRGLLSVTYLIGKPCAPRSEWRRTPPKQ